MNEPDWSGKLPYESDRSVFRGSSGRFRMIRNIQAPDRFSIVGIHCRRKGHGQGSRRLARRQVVDQRCSRKPRLASSITALSVLEVECYDQDT